MSDTYIVTTNLIFLLVLLFFQSFLKGHLDIRCMCGGVVPKIKTLQPCYSVQKQINSGPFSLRMGFQQLV